MKRNLVLISIILVLGIMFTGCSAGLTATAIEGEWFCQVGTDGGVLENEYTFDLKADGTYKFTYIYLALGFQDLKNSGYENGAWVYDEASKILTLTPNSGDEYSFEILTLFYPKTRLKWTDTDSKLETFSGASEGVDGIFSFDLQTE